MKLQFTNGYRPHFDQISRILQFLLAQEDRKKIPQKEIVDSLGIPTNQVENLISIMIGFGLVRYKSPATGREVDWFKIGFSPRKSNFSLHLVMDIKKQVDEKVLINTQMLNNESYFDKLMIQMVIGSFGQHKIELDPESARYINTCLVKEYMNEYQGNRAC